jgi:AmiR/NasT family two-component response regulator
VSRPRSDRHVFSDVSEVLFADLLRHVEEAKAEFRKTRPTMPVAVISANHQREVVDRARAVGATFLPKPVTEQALKEFLATAAQRRQDFDP